MTEYQNRLKTSGPVGRVTSARSIPLSLTKSSGTRNRQIMSGKPQGSAGKKIFKMNNQQNSGSFTMFNSERD